MEGDWHWQGYKNNFKKERIYYELWRIWWSICTTGIKRKIK